MGLDRDGTAGRNRDRGVLHCGEGGAAGRSVSGVRWDGDVAANTSLLHLHVHHRVTVGSAHRQGACSNARGLRARCIEWWGVVFRLRCTEVRILQ